MRLLPEFLGYWPGCRQAKLGLAHELNMLAKREVKRVLSSVAIRERGINKGDPSSGAGLRFSFKQGQELCITVQSWAGVLMSTTDLPLSLLQFCLQSGPEFSETVWTWLPGRHVPPVAGARVFSSPRIRFLGNFEL